MPVLWSIESLMNMSLIFDGTPSFPQTPCMTWQCLVVTNVETVSVCAVQQKVTLTELCPKRRGLFWNEPLFLSQSSRAISALPILTQRPLQSYLNLPIIVTYFWLTICIVSRRIWQVICVVQCWKDNIKVLNFPCIWLLYLDASGIWRCRYPSLSKRDTVLSCFWIF